MNYYDWCINMTAVVTVAPAHISSLGGFVLKADVTAGLGFTNITIS